MMSTNDPREDALMLQQGLHPDCAVIDPVLDFRGKYDLADLLIIYYTERRF